MAAHIATHPPPASWQSAREFIDKSQEPAQVDGICLLLGGGHRGNGVAAH